MSLENNIEPKNNNTETEPFQQNFEHIQKEIKELSDADGSNDIVEGIDGMLNNEFSNYLLKQNSDILNNLYTSVCNYAKNSNDSNLSKLQNFLDPIILIDGISKSTKIEKTEVYDYIINNAFPKYGYKIGNKLNFIKYFSNAIIKEHKSLTTLLKDLEDKETNSAEFDEFIKSYLGEKRLTFTIPYGTQLHGNLSQSKYLTTCISYYPNSFGNDCILPEGFNPQKLFEEGKSIGLGIEAVHEKYTGAGVKVAMIDTPLAPHNDLNDQIKKINSVKIKETIERSEGITAESLIQNPEGLTVIKFQKKGIDINKKEPQEIRICVEDGNSLKREIIVEARVIDGKTIQLKQKFHYHGVAVASILAGQQTGIAPDAELYYLESNSEINNNDILDRLTQIQNINEKLKKNGEDIIRVVSISSNLYENGMNDETKNKIKEKVNELRDMGTWVLSGEEFIKNFGILGKKNPMGDSNDFQNYQVTRPDYRTSNGHQTNGMEDFIFINSGDRTVTDPNSPELYRHDAIGGTSWTIPAVAGYYTLACQADPENMNPERFMQLARETAQLVPISDIPGDMNNVTKGKTSMQATIKVLDIQALIQKIEEEKNK